MAIGAYIVCAIECTGLDRVLGAFWDLVHSRGTIWKRRTSNSFIPATATAAATAIHCYHPVLSATAIRIAILSAILLTSAVISAIQSYHTYLLHAYLSIVDCRPYVSSICELRSSMNFAASIHWEEDGTFRTNYAWNPALVIVSIIREGLGEKSIYFYNSYQGTLVEHSYKIRINVLWE